jgi:hypothetical protein
VDHYEDAQAAWQAPSFLDQDENGSYYLWYIPPNPFYAGGVLGVYSEPPPADMSGVQYYRVGNGRAARAAAWISSRANEALEVAEQLPGWPIPPR